MMTIPKPVSLLVAVLASILCSSCCSAWSLPPSRGIPERGEKKECSSSSMRESAPSRLSSRRDFVVVRPISAASSAIVAWLIVERSSASPAHASSSSSSPSPDERRRDDKKIGISDEDLATILRRDVEVNQFLVRADLTRSIYDESATFTDEIDTYAMDAWIQGTKRLFVAAKSHVDLVPESIRVTKDEATFNFTEYLTFNIPLLQPKVYLSGQVVLKRDPTTGLITSYREKWDQDVSSVLRSAKFGGGGGT